MERTSGGLWTGLGFSFWGEVELVCRSFRREDDVSSGLLFEGAVGGLLISRFEITRPVRGYVAAIAALYLPWYNFVDQRLVLGDGPFVSGVVFSV